MPSSTHRRTHAPRAWTIFSSSDSIFSSSDSRVLTHRTREFSLEFSRLCVRCERERERERERKRERERERERDATVLALPCLHRLCETASFGVCALSVVVQDRLFGVKHSVFVARSQTLGVCRTQPNTQRTLGARSCVSGGVGRILRTLSCGVCRTQRTLATLSLLFLAVFVAPGQTLRDLLVFS